MMIKQVKEYINAHDMIKPGMKLVLAVSGGPDSMALLDIMARLREELAIELWAAHLHHGLRPEADDEQVLVEERCRFYEIELGVKKTAVAELAAREGLSLEDAGRRARYAFLEQWRKQQGADAVATAHHRDDRAETVLLHLLRGSGIRGLRGIMPVNGNLIRPLLGCSKEEILLYLEQWNLTYAIDESNWDLRYTRNRIRHELLPELFERYNPAIREGLNRLADLAAADEAWMERLCREALPDLITAQENGRVAMDIKKLRLEDLALQRRALHMVLKQLSVADWGLREVDDLLELSRKSGSSRRLSLQGGVEARLEYDSLILSLRPEEPSESFCWSLTEPGRITLNAGQEWEIFRAQRGNRQQSALDLVMDEDKVRWPLCLRSRCPGDRFMPLGMTGSKKLKDVLMEMKIPAWQRDMIPILASHNGDIYALPGRGVSRLAAPTSDTQRFLVLRCAG